MENATLTMSLPRAMKNYIVERLHEANFNTPTEYIRSFIRLDQQLRSREAIVHTATKHKGPNGTKCSPPKEWPRIWEE